jgi:hypothetical protein
MAISISPATVVFWVAFFLMLTVCGLLHFHGVRGLLVSGIGAEAIVLLSRPWWKKGSQPLKRSEESFRDPSLGSRAERRAAKQRHK